MLTTDFITDRLSAVADEYGIQLRYSNESGSRAWGLASTDSDYDVRFIYQHPREWYLRLDQPMDMIGPIMELDGELDLVGWDIRKVLFHLVGSNAGVIEWLYSPVLYFADAAFRAELREIAAHYFNGAKVAHHYRGISRSAVKAGYSEDDDRWNLKKYFYYLRSLLAADRVLQTGQAPPITFEELRQNGLSVDIRSALDELRDQKGRVKEDFRMTIPVVIAQHFQALEQDISDRLATAAPHVAPDGAIADKLFRDLIGY